MKRILLLSCLILMTGCATITPYIQNFNVISIDQERAMSDKIAAEIANTMPVVSDASLNGRVNSIGNRLVQALPRRDFNYRFFVIRDNSPNAFTTAGGNIYVHTGLLQMTDDDELAGVLGHEIGHAVERHPAKTMSRQYGVDYLSNLLFKGTKANWQALALNLAKGSVLTHYGREEEYEADSVSFALLPRAGFKTDGLLRFLRKLQTIQGRGLSLPFLSSHPPTPERVLRLEAMAQR